MDLGAPERNSKTSLTQRFLDAFQKFDFYQAVRLLEVVRAQTVSKTGSQQALLGHAGPPDNEATRFRGIPTLSFPPSPICHAEQTYDDVDGDPHQIEIAVAFLSLFGTQGALPRHYTEHVVERVRNGDSSLLEFLNLFQHRTLSFLYRAWVKHRISPSVQLGRLADRDSSIDQITEILLALCGLGTRQLIAQSHIDPDFVAFYSGHLSRNVSRTESLHKIVSDYYGIPVQIVEFIGRWVPIPESSQSHLERSPRANANLGSNAVSGSRMFDQTSTVRLRLGPLSYADFQRFLPGCRDYEQLCQVVRYLLGIEFDFEVQLVLKATEVPMGQLGSVAGPRLGVDFWVSSKPAEQDVDDVLFRPTIQGFREQSSQ